jgi:hypothetical protein
VGVNVVLLAFTCFRYDLGEGPGLIPRLYIFNLTSENNVAAWWSGALLLIASLHAFDGFKRWRESEPLAARGWLALSAVLLLLSADEIASIHERVHQFLPGGKWGARLPFALILLWMLGYGLLALWRTPSQRTKVWAIALGFTCFATAAVTEFVEHRVVWEGWAARLRGVWEEGIELLGMTILLGVCMRNSRGLFDPVDRRAFPVFEGVCLPRRVALPIGLVVAVPLAWVTARLPDQGRGHPADWLTVVAFAFGAMVVARPFLRDGSKLGLSRWLLAGLCTIAAPAILVSIPRYTIDVPWSGTSFRLVVLSGIALATGAVWLAAVDIRRANRGWALPLLVVVPVLALIPSGLFVYYAAPQIVALLVYHVHAAEGCVAA